MLRIGKWLKKRKKSNRALKILLTTNAFVLIAGAMLAPIYAIFVEEIGGDLLDASITAGIFAVAAGLTTLASGRFSDKIKNSELVIVFGYLLLGGGFIAITQVNSIGALFIVQAIIGIAEAIYAPAFDSLYSRHLDKHQEGSEWGSWEAINYFTYAGGQSSAD